MVKRVSLKGKGADLFFGDTPPVQPAALATATAAVSTDQPPTTDRELDPESNQASALTSQPARLHASKRASVHSVEAAVNLSEVLPAIYDQVAARATVSGTFRYTAGELERLADALYQVTKRHRVRLTKQDVARLGLNAVLWDYETRGKDSLLTQLALRKKREPGAET